MSPVQNAITSDRIQDALYGFTRSQILFSALDLQLFTHIAEGKTTLSALVEATDLDERGLRILLDGLVGVGFLTKQNQQYYLPDDVARFLVKDGEDYIGGMVHHCKRLYEIWSLLTDAVQAGQPVGGAQSMAQLETYFAELVKGLYVSNYPTAKKLAKELGMGKKRTGLNILDVAGGSGVWSIALLEADKASHGTLLDFPTVTQVAEEYVNKHHLSDRYSYWPEDLEMFDFPEAQFDLAILGNICHALGPVGTEKLLMNMGKTIKSGGELAIVDFVPDDARAKSGWPLIFAVNMLISTPEGDVFTKSDYEGWLKKAGFTQVDAHEIDAEVTLILAKK